MFNKFLLLLNGLLLSSFCLGQRLAPSVIATGGGFFSSGAYSLSYTYGELSVRTLTKSTNILTEGFQQGKLHVIIPNGFKDILYGPNPLRDRTNESLLHLKFYLDDGQSFLVEVFSLTGKAVGLFEYNNVTYGDDHAIEFSRFAKGLYLVKIQSKDGKIQRTFKIVKI